jgi:hypothetical protein
MLRAAGIYKSQNVESQEMELPRTLEEINAEETRAEKNRAEESQATSRSSADAAMFSTGIVAFTIVP